MPGDQQPTTRFILAVLAKSRMVDVARDRDFSLRLRLEADTLFGVDVQVVFKEPDGVHGLSADRSTESRSGVPSTGNR